MNETYILQLSIDSNTPKRTKTPKAANPNSSTNAPTPFQDENVGSETPQDKDGGKNVKYRQRAFCCVTSLDNTLTLSPCFRM